MGTNYLRMEYLIGKIEEPNRSACMKLYEENRKLWEKSPGSSHNHQAWEGGYLDHITEVMNIAVNIYESLNAVRPLPFSLSDALLVLYLHDLEKPWKHVGKVKMENKAARHEFRLKKSAQYGIQLTAEHLNGIKYAEGEIDDYSPKKRFMGPLAAFAHMCDVCSARVWHDHPKENPNLWMYSQRFRS
ncbi:MAG: hypothetical protein Q7S83_02350 [bacterium]|nr:hypothetical protein [bacterium]